MRIGRWFMFGSVAGVVVGWLWGRKIQASVGEKTWGVRARAAEGIHVVGETTEKVLDRGEEALRRAGEFVHDTTEHVSAVLAPRTGQPAPTVGEHRIWVTGPDLADTTRRGAGGTPEADASANPASPCHTRPSEEGRPL